MASAMTQQAPQLQKPLKSERLLFWNVKQIILFCFALKFSRSLQLKDARLARSISKRSRPISSFLLGLILLVSAQVLLSQSTASTKNTGEAATTQLAPQVKLRLTETVSSTDAKVGQLVSLEVVDPVQVDGKVIIAAGAHARASITTARRRGHNRREGQLVLTIESVSRVDGQKALLQSANVQKGSGHGQPIFGPCTFPIPADPVGLFRKGNDVVIPKGTELVAAITPGGL
jgi:hypothetical protein